MDGDPSTFSMNLKILKPRTGPMMKLIKYDLGEFTDVNSNTEIEGE